MNGHALSSESEGCYLSFHSLQTGKHIWTLAPGDGMVYHKFVSIPFKRESIYEHIFKWISKNLWWWVSIPFKRESIYERGEKGDCDSRSDSFPFPSNGKAYMNLARAAQERNRWKVSIPFKRESISELSELPQARSRWPGGVSIPFKRENISERIMDLYLLSAEDLFPFPSNGKAYLNAPVLNPVGPWLQNAKTKRELREPFFNSKFSPKIPQTHVCIDPNTIF